VILFGATGMVGQGLLRECLLDPGIERVQHASRASPASAHSGEQNPRRAREEVPAA
jgi:hypothetical protein